ncbi:RNA-binding protein [Candidatus Woesearchaeota archaeon]|nr:RNA-binding protein [Candidatus Woesearchaeota archaeon]
MTTDALNVKEKDIVVPGESLAVGMGFLPSWGTYRDGDSIRASRLGLVQMDGKVIKLVPLSGAYLPRMGDVIIGLVIDVLMSGWRVDTFSPYSAVLTLAEATSEFIPKKADLTKYFDIGDVIMTKVTNVTSQNLVDVSMKGPGLRKLGPGRTLVVDPHRVPRVIGKNGSMVSMIKDHTGCNILVGQNGVVWLSGEPENEVITVQAIERICAESHISGLTEKMQRWLEQNAKHVNRSRPQEPMQ